MPRMLKRTLPWALARACAIALLVAPITVGPIGGVIRAQAQPAEQSDALARYNTALNQFKAILRERRAQIDAKQPLPNLPGQAVYLARNNMISAYKDLTDAAPSRI